MATTLVLLSPERKVRERERMDQKGAESSVREKDVFYRNIYYIGGWGVSATVKSFRFVSFGRKSVRAVWLASGIRTQKTVPTFSLFPLFCTISLISH